MKQTEILTHCNSCKRLGTSRLHELHESKFPFVSRIEFIRSKLSNFSAHVSVVIEAPTTRMYKTRLHELLSTNNESLERITSISETQKSFDSAAETNPFTELHESELSSLIESILFKHSFYVFAYVNEVTECMPHPTAHTAVLAPEGGGGGGSATTDTMAAIHRNEGLGSTAC